MRLFRLRVYRLRRPRLFPHLRLLTLRLRRRRRTGRRGLLHRRRLQRRRLGFQPRRLHRCHHQLYDMAHGSRPPGWAPAREVRASLGAPVEDYLAALAF